MEQLPQALKALEAEGALILSAPPGSGKTTRLPLAIHQALSASPQLAAAWGGDQVLVLQPRRLAARSVASYMASLLGEQPGGRVGYQVRFDSALSAQTRVTLLTEGLLTRRALSDPELAGVGCVILDEFHERSLQADLALALLLELREAYRPELRLVVMSATLGEAAAQLSARLKCPLIQAEGRAFPVELHYEAKAHSSSPCERAPALIVERWRALQAERLAERRVEPERAGGSILVFLPGRREIEQARFALNRLDPSIPVSELYSGLKASEQRRALDPKAPPRVVLSTNVAETSVTIEGVSEVIDTGLARGTLYDPKRGLERLCLAPIALDAAIQRAGRAGRTHAGRCHRLWTEHQEAQRPAQSVPEHARAELSSALLTVAAWAGDWRSFEWYERPPELHLERAEAHLQLLGALDERGRVTPLGEALNTVSLPPALALSLAFALRCDCLELAALLSSVSAQDRELLELDPQRPRAVDVWLRVEALQDFERGRVWPELRRAVADSALRGARQLTRQAKRLAEATSALELLEAPLEAALRQMRLTGGAGSLAELSLKERVGLALSLGSPHRVTQLRSAREGRALMSEGGEVALRREAIGSPCEYVVSLALYQSERASPRVTLACPVERSWLVGRVERELCFYEERAGVYRREREYLGELCLSERLSPAPFDEEASALLLETLSRAPWRWLALDERAQRWLERARWLAARQADIGSEPKPHAGALEPWWGLSPDDERRFEPGERPQLSERVLALLEALCSPQLYLKSPSFKGLKALSLSPMMQGLTPVHELQMIERLAPERYELPTGQRVSVSYELGAPPSVSAYLQAFFGSTEHPSLGEGAEAIPLQLTLLAPNKRPAQITSDLPSFWSGAYADVRKQLRARYAKHHWPEDPLSIGPQRGAKRRS